MDQDLITDVTFDHLPDLSDASVSFQIPSNNASADLLLADTTYGFKALCDAVDDDASFPPVTITHPRGPPLTLGELTPRVQVASRSPRPPRSPTPTASSAKPSVIQRTLTLGRCNPDKPRKIPSPTKSIRRQFQTPLVSSERLEQLREEVETLGQEATHVQTHVKKFPKLDSVECSSSPRAHSRVPSNAREGPPQSEDPLVSLPEEKDAPQDVEPAADQDVVMTTADSCHADTTSVAVPAQMPTLKRNPRTRKPAVAAGGISKRTAFSATHVSKKTKGKPPRVQEAYPVLPSAARQPTSSRSIDAEEELVPPAHGDIDLNPEKTQITLTSTGRLAERLVSYSQKLISSIGLYKPIPENSCAEARNDAVRVADARFETQPAAARPPSPPCINDVANPHRKPLRLSEISPHKLPPDAFRPSSPANTGTLQDGRQHAMSPMRPAKKHVSMDADQPQEYHRRKRGKTMAADAESERGSSKEAVSQGQPTAKKATGVHEDEFVLHPETRDGTQRLERSKSSLPSARTKYRPKLTSSRCKGPTLNAFPYMSSSRQVHERINKGRGKRDERQSKAAMVRSESSLSGFSTSSRLRRDGRTRRDHDTESSRTRRRSGPTSTTDLPMIEKKQNATPCVAQLTNPIGFTFRVDARLEARKTEDRLAASEPGQTRPPCVVPDVRAASHHAAFEREAVPSVPVVPFFFYTEQRAKERGKFDEMVRRKEEESVRLREEQRRREAEEEAKAIKELRRRAIPRANEVPEWYADLPKRRGTAV